jgi:hypothetical protein
LQPVTEEEEMSSSSSSSSGASIATTVPVEEVFPAGATALPGPGLYPALLELPDQVIKMRHA